MKLQRKLPLHAFRRNIIWETIFLTWIQCFNILIFIQIIRNKFHYFFRALLSIGFKCQWYEICRMLFSWNVSRFCFLQTMHTFKAFSKNAFSQLIPTIVPLLTLMISSSSDEFIKYCIDSLIHEIIHFMLGI